MLWSGYTRTSVNPPPWYEIDGLKDKISAGLLAACPDSMRYFIHVPPNVFVPKLNAASVPDAAFRLPRIPAECYCSRRFLVI
jgi:hypothetical protein